MNIFAILDAAILWIYGILVIFFTLKYWSHPKKTLKIKISELIYGVAYILNGIFILNLFQGQNLSPEKEQTLFLILFIVFMAILFWLWIPNILYTKLRVDRHPELLSPDAPLNRNFDIYWEKLETEYENNAETKDIMKDLSRKALHILVLGIVIGCHEIPKLFESELATMGYTPLAIRNFSYMILAFFFLLMFTSADICRVYCIKILPDWALKWYGKSVEPSTEKYTYISSVPFLLTLMLFVPTDFAVILSAAMVSCISDAAASVVGKNFGKHKMTNFGRYPNKTYEGFIAGATSAFLCVFLVFEFYPVPGVTLAWQIAFGLISAAAFVYIDAFSKYVVDNVLNIMVPGLLVLLCTTFLI